MKSHKGLIIGLIVFLLVLVGGGFTAKHFIDKKVADNHKIVATSAAIVEIFDKLNLNLAGVPKTQAKLPARYQNVPKIGSPMNPSVEKIASLNPTHVYAVSTLKDQYGAAFKKQSVDVTYLKLDSVNDLKSTLNNLGKEYYRTSEANTQINKINIAVKKVKTRIHGRKPKVLVLMGLPGANYMILTNKSYVGNLVQIAGGENVYHSNNQIYLSPSNESLATKNPDVILRLEHALPKVTLPQFKREFKTNSLWKKMLAVKNQRVYDLQQPDFNASANMNVPIALNKVSHWLYPEK